MYDPEVFDDADFYQQLLREVISGDSAMGSLSSVQQRRQKTAQNEGPTREQRAQIRYVNIPKLTAF